MRLAYRLISFETRTRRSRAGASARPGATLVAVSLSNSNSAKVNLQAGLVDDAGAGARPQHVVLRGAIAGTARDRIRPVILVQQIVDREAEDDVLGRVQARYRLTRSYPVEGRYPAGTSLLAPNDDHCAARISLRSSNRTPPVVVILRGVMVAARHWSRRSCRGSGDRRRRRTTGRRRTAFRPRSPRSCACAMFWYWKNWLNSRRCREQNTETLASTRPDRCSQRHRCGRH